MNARKDRTLVAQPQPHGVAAPKAVEADATALQALAEGVANEGQQKRALDWILKGACGLATWPYCATERETNVALGRQFVGHQIVSMIDVKISTFRRDTDG